jgi:hypothetical protein
MPQIAWNTLPRAHFMIPTGELRWCTEKIIHSGNSNYKPNARGYNWDILILGEINTGAWPSRLRGVSKIETINYAHESRGTEI